MLVKLVCNQKCYDLHKNHCHTCTANRMWLESEIDWAIIVKLELLALQKKKSRNLD